MKQTENLQLPILQSGDKYTKETQNEAFEKVDLHLGGLAKRVNNIVASGGESNIEIVDARRDNNTGVVYNTIGKRIDTVSEQLSKAKRFGMTIRNNNPKVAIKTEEYKFPDTFLLRYDVLPKVYKNKEQFITDFDVSDFKNTGGKTIYVSTKNGLSTNDGLTREKPCQSLQKASTLASDGDTILIIDEEGTLIPRAGWFENGYVTKSLNVISENNVIHFQGDIPSWTKTNGYNNKKCINIYVRSIYK